MQGSAYALIILACQVSTIVAEEHSCIMAEGKAAATSNGRPKAIHTSNSFTRMDPPPSPLSPRKRASTMQEKGITAVPEARHISVSPEISGKRHVTDVFENQEDDGPAQSGTGTPGPELQVPSTFDDLPIEISSLTERVLESLSAKVHPTPLSADALSGMFQDFYERASSHIATHIASLSSRIGREKSPAPSTGSRGSMMGRARAGSGAKRTESSPSNSGGEMLTASEVADRRKARRLLELKRLALEEAVERAVCEKVYDGIYKHKSTDDDERDGKLRSRTAALVGIGLKELHVDSPSNEDVRNATEEKGDDINQSLAPAREALQMMDDEHYPLGKLQHLIAAHKSIVETLSQLFPATSSADEILPTLIYTLITSPPEGLDIVSNLNFIQRFRASSKVDGEAAYCLVNLEAAISFLETVALPSLRAEELPEGPPKGESGYVTPGLEEPTQDATMLLSKPPAAQALKPGVSTVSAVSTDTSSSPTEAVKALPSPRTPPKANQTTAQQRRISALVQAQADRIEAGRENILNTADKIYESINGTLENSFQFVFGRFKDRSADDSPLPKTLEDARKLVSSPSLNQEEDDSLSHSGRSSPALDDPLNTTTVKSDGKMLEVLGGRRQLRDRSVDSARSTGSSSKRVLFPNEQAKPKDDPPTPAGNLFATINPLNRFSVPSFPRFGRTGSLPNTPNQPSPGTEKPLSKLGDIVESPVSTRDAEMPALEKTRSAESNDDDLNAREALAELRKLKPPNGRFLQVRNAGDLKISEVEELLADYRRLAKAIGEAIAM